MMNSFKKLFSNSDEVELKEIQFEFNDYLSYYSNYCEKKCFLCSSEIKDKGQFVIEEDKILIGIDSKLYNNYYKTGNVKITRLNFLYLELCKLPKISYFLSPKDIFDCLTEDSCKKISKRKRRGYYGFYLLGYKLENNIQNYIFIKITADLGGNKNPFLTENSKLTIFAVRDISFDFLRTRGGSQKIYDKILVVGCGSVGSEVVEILAGSGFLDITIIDNENLKYENAYRNTTGFVYLDKFKEYSKTSTLKKFIEVKYPDATISTVVDDIVDLLYSNGISLDLFKYIIICTGNNVLQKFINNFIYEKNIKTKLLFAWLEPYGIAEHILAVNTSQCGCYNCLCKSKNNVHFSMNDTDYKIRNNVCSGSYTPYGRISTIRLATFISELLLNDYNSIKEINNNHYVNKGNFEKYLSEGFKLTDYANYTQKEIDALSKDFIYEGCEVCGKHSSKL